jgi:hypothetical protein
VEGTKLCGRGRKEGGRNLHKGRTGLEQLRRLVAGGLLPVFTHEKIEVWQIGFSRTPLTGNRDTKQDQPEGFNLLQETPMSRDNFFTKIAANPLGKRDSAEYDSAGFVGTLNAAVAFV